MEDKILSSTWRLQAAWMCCRCRFPPMPICLYRLLLVKDILLLCWHKVIQWPLIGTAEWRTKSKVCNHYGNRLSCCCVDTGTSVRHSNSAREFFPRKLFMRLLYGTGPRASGFVSTTIWQSAQAWFYFHSAHVRQFYAFFWMLGELQSKTPVEANSNLNYKIHHLDVTSKEERVQQIANWELCSSSAWYVVKYLLLLNLGV